MSVLTPKRAAFSVVALFLLTTAAYAANPSPRTWVRSAYDVSTGQVVLFGGQSAFDTGTQLTYDSNETWLWNGARWIQRHTTQSPPPRSLHEMVYDSARQRIVLFGGRFQKPTENTDYGFLSDTWAFKNNEWTQIETADAPSPRYWPGMAYDPVRDRIVLYGGSTSDFASGEVTNIHDTWEFDGTNWTKVGTDNQVTVNKALLEFDRARGELIMVAQDADFKFKMYRYQPDAHTWQEITFATDAKKPDCVNDAALVYQSHERNLMLSGGICPTTATTSDQTWEWDGTTWKEVDIALDPSRVVGHAMSYDERQMETVMFGGTSMFATAPRSLTQTYDGRSWRFGSPFVRPSPRSLGAFETDPVNNWVWMLSGLNEFGSGYLSDIWSYRSGQWFQQPTTDTPTECTAPLSAWDKDRNKLVLVCGAFGSDEVSTYELTGLTWKQLTPEDNPDHRRWAGLVYDETLKKTVLFGGFDSRGSYRHDTWTWDGTNWREVKNDRPEHRALFAMWYDPLQKRTLVYGGLGRPNIDARVSRFGDMWAFTGDRWTKLTVAETPGERFGPQYVVNPQDGKVLLFGGLRAEKVNPEDDLRRQFYDNDTWTWDGTTSRWTKLAPATSPRMRENGMMAWDPAAQKIVMFGGYAGFFYSDIWIWTGDNWVPEQEQSGGRRRPSGRGGDPPPPYPGG